MAFIDNENNEDDIYVPKDRNVQKEKKNWFNKNIIVFLLVLLFIYVLFNMGGDGNKKENKGKKDEFLDVVEENTLFSQYIQEPAKQTLVEIEKDMESKDVEHEHKKKPIVYEEFKNKYKQVSKGTNKKEKKDNRYPVPPSQHTAGFDRGKYMNEVLSGVKSLTQEEPEPTLEDRLNVKKLDESFAYLEKHLDMKMLPGKIIPAILDFSIHSSLPGKIRAIVSSDVYSERAKDGQRVLIPGGSRLIGQYASGIDFGVNRLFIVWETVMTKDGHVININSPSVGPLGRSGQHMFIDSHFWQRFGSSILLSVINAGVSAAAGVVTDGNSQAIQDVKANFNRSSEMALEQALKIKPTGHAHHGARINVFVARKLDFTHIYRDELE